MRRILTESKTLSDAQPDTNDLHTYRDTIYDATGHILSSNQGSPIDSRHWEFDASGRQWRWEELGPYGPNIKKAEETTFDGDRRQAKRRPMTSYKVAAVWEDWLAVNFYYIYSSVTGQKVATLIYDGSQEKNHIYLGDTMIAVNKREKMTP